MVLGSDVIVDNPSNPKIIARLQVRNMRVTVDNQMTTMQMELFKHDAPIESYNLNVTVPVKPIRETHERQIERTKKPKVVPKPPIFRIFDYINDLTEWEYKIHAYIITQILERRNYLTGTGE